MDLRVFLDASFWIAYREPRDARAPRANELLRQLFQARTRFVTTLPVLCEIQAYFSRHAVRRQTVLVDLWQNPVVDFEDVTYRDQQSAITLLRDHTDKSFSLCDAVSFVVMRRLGLCRVVTFDHHFTQFANFEVIR
jgi:predicted nucleic acid-binding protein